MSNSTEDIIYFKYNIHSQMEAVCRRYMNLSLNYNEITYILDCLNLPVYNITAVCAHRNIHVLRLLLRKRLEGDDQMNDIFIFLKRKKINEISLQELEDIFNKEFPIDMTYRIYFCKTLIGSETFYTESDLIGKKYPLSNVCKYFKKTQSLIEEAVIHAVYNFNHKFLEDLRTVIDELNFSFMYSVTSRSTVNDTKPDLFKWLREAKNNYSKLLEENFIYASDTATPLDCEKTLINFVKYFQ